MIGVSGSHLVHAKSIIAFARENARNSSLLRHFRGLYPQELALMMLLADGAVSIVRLDLLREKAP